MVPQTKKDHDNATLPLTKLILAGRAALIEDAKTKKSLLKPGEDKGPDGAEG